MLLTVKHTTIYWYRRPVVLLPHRLMLTPRSSRQLDPTDAPVVLASVRRWAREAV